MYRCKVRIYIINRNYVPCLLNHGLNIQFRVLVPIQNGSGGSNVLCVQCIMDSGLSAIASNLKLDMS